MFVLSNSLIACIEGKTSSIWLCTSNANLQPDSVRITGARVEDDRKHIVVFVPVHTGAGVIQNLTAGHKVSFLTAVVHTNVSYQLKGKYISRQACTEEDLSFQAAYLDSFTSAIATQGLNKQKGYKAYFQQPTIAVRILVEEVYEQTPKKGTGEKIPANNQ